LYFGVTDGIRALAYLGRRWEYKYHMLTTYGRIPLITSIQEITKQPDFSDYWKPITCPLFSIEHARCYSDSRSEEESEPLAQLMQPNGALAYAAKQPAPDSPGIQHPP
jgi:hypothetical protein